MGLWECVDLCNMSVSMAYPATCVCCMRVLWWWRAAGRRPQCKSCHTGSWVLASGPCSQYATPLALVPSQQSQTPYGKPWWLWEKGKDGKQWEGPQEKNAYKQEADGERQAETLMFLFFKTLLQIKPNRKTERCRKHCKDCKTNTIKIVSTSLRASWTIHAELQVEAEQDSPTPAWPEVSHHILVL